MDLNEENFEVKVHWGGYSHVYNFWVPINWVRLPVDTRPLLSRNPISKDNFPIRKEPRQLQGGVNIYDMVPETVPVATSEYTTDVLGKKGS